MLIFVVNLENDSLSIDIKSNSTIIELKKLIMEKWRMKSIGFACFHNKKKLNDNDIIDECLYGSDPTITVFDEEMYIPVCTDESPVIKIDKDDDEDISVSKFIILCSKYPRFEDMMRLLLYYDSRITYPIICTTMKKVKKHELDASKASAFFCSKIKEEIQDLISYE